MKKGISDILVTCYVSVLLIYMVVGNINRIYGFYSTKQISETLVYFGLAGIIICIFNRILNKIKFDIYDVLVLFLAFFGMISTFYAIDDSVALHGFDGRYEGLLQIVTYYILFLNCKNIDNKVCKYILIGVIIILGCAQAIYAILQFVNVRWVFDYRIIRKRFYSTGFEVNPNFLSTVMILTLTLSMSLYFLKKNVFVSILTLVTSSILFFGLLCSGAMSGAVAFVVILLCLLILFFVLKMNIWWTLGKMLLIIICFTLIYNKFNLYDNGYYSYQVNKTVDEIGDTVLGEAKPIYGSGRIHIWRETLKVVPENLWNGVGIDNFYFAFGDNEILIDVKSGLAVDKAHNEYLHKLVTEGIFSFATYLILLCILVITSIIKIFKDRRNQDYLFVILFLSFLAYCVQAFFNISVISVAPLFYIIMGLLCSLVKKKVRDEKVEGK